MPSRHKAPETPASSLVRPEYDVTAEAVTATAAEATVRLYPTHTAYIPDEPAAERDVTAEEAERLLAYQPPAYTTEPPEPTGDPPPAEEVGQPEEPVEQAGSSDSDDKE